MVRFTVQNRNWCSNSFTFQGRTQNSLNHGGDANSPVGSGAQRYDFAKFSENRVRHGTSNDRPFSCPIIYIDTNSQCYFVYRHLNNVWNSNAHWLMGTPYLTIIDSNIEKILVRLGRGWGECSSGTPRSPLLWFIFDKRCGHNFIK